MRAYRLAIGIQQGEGYLSFPQGTGLYALGLFIAYHGHAHCLPWSVDASVCKDALLLAGGLVVVVRETPAQISGGRIWVVLGVGIEDAGLPFVCTIIIGIESFSLVVGGEGGFSCHLAMVVPVSFSQDDGRVREGLSTGATYGDEAHAVVGEILVDDGHVAHVDDFPRGLYVLAVALYLYQIGALGQRCQLEGVFQYLIGGMVGEGDFLRDFSLGGEVLLEYRVILFGIVVTFRGKVEPSHGQRQPLYVADFVNDDGEWLCRPEHFLEELGVEHGVLQSFLGIAQDVHARPCSPPPQCVVNVFHFLLGGGFRQGAHGLVTLYGQLSRLLQVGILADE